MNTLRIWSEDFPKYDERMAAMALDHSIWRAFKGAELLALETLPVVRKPVARQMPEFSDLMYRVSVR